MSRWRDALQDWAIGIDRRTGSLTVLGVVLSLTLLAAAGTVFALFGGVFTRYDPISVRLPANSTAVLPGSSVQYRDVSIGKVVGRATTGADGVPVLRVHLEPGTLDSVPASVRAQVVPISVFGNQYVVLQPPDGATGGPSLRRGAQVQAAEQAPSVSVQATIGSLDRLLVALRPAELNAALTAVAQALQGQGESLGQTADVASTYLAAIEPLWPQIVQNLGLLAPVARQVAASSPDIVGILGNQLTTAQTINANPELIDRILRGSAGAADQFEQLNTQIERPFSLLAQASGPFLDAISANPQTISQLLDGLDEFAKSVTAAGRAGPFLSVSASVAVQNPADLTAAALGGEPRDMLASLAAGIGRDLVDPPGYDAGDRPAFPDRSDSSGRDAALAALAGGPASSPAALGAVVPSLPADQERAAVSDVAGAVLGTAPASPDVAALLLSPVLSHLGQPS